MAQFRPVGITTGFGSSRFNVNDLGQVTEAGYSLTPELQALRNRLIGMATMAPTPITTRTPQVPQGYSLTPPEGLLSAGTAVLPREGFTYAYGPSGDRIEVPLTETTTYQQPAGYTPEQFQQQIIPQLSTGVSSLFNLGQGYLAESPQEAAQRFVNQQQALLAPAREAQLANVRGRLFARGRGGLGVQTGTGSAPASPELQAYYNALAQQDLELAARGQQAGMEQARFGAGLLTGATELGRQIPAIQSQAFLPLETQLGLARTVEGLGQQPFLLSQELAAAQAGAGARAGGIYQTGMQSAIANQQRADAYSPLGSFLSGAGGGLGGMFSGTSLGGIGGIFSNPNQYGGFFGGGTVPTSSSGFESWESPYIRR